MHRTDSGEYRCVARNSLGNETSNVTALDVQCKYRIFVFIVLRNDTFNAAALDVLKGLKGPFIAPSGFGTKQRKRR